MKRERNEEREGFFRKARILRAFGIPACVMGTEFMGRLYSTMWKNYFSSLAVLVT